MCCLIYWMFYTSGTKQNIKVDLKIKSENIINDFIAILDSALQPLPADNKLSNTIKNNLYRFHIQNRKT